MQLALTTRRITDRMAILIMALITDLITRQTAPQSPAVTLPGTRLPLAALAPESARSKG